MGLQHSILGDITTKQYATGTSKNGIQQLAQTNA
jgi:hypothetical protein